MIRILIGISSLLLLASCKKEYSAPVPDYNNWSDFSAAQPLQLATTTRKSMEGVYTLTDGADQFGEQVALKWNFHITGTDTFYHFSAFCGKDIAYLICEGKRQGNNILLNGYWRKMSGVATGIVRLTIKDSQGGNLIFSNGAVTPGSITISGVWGDDQSSPSNTLTMTYNRPLHKRQPFHILAHRSGGRTSDLLPVSENSVAMILKTPEFGSTGVEIDVRYTKDGIPILYHDVTINLRETQKSGLVGPIKNYTYEQLNAFVRLIHGERIPTLREALDAVLYRTELDFVWLDTKFDSTLTQLRSIQKEYLQKAAAAGRNLQIVIGMPTADVIDNFLALPDYAQTPSLCELSLDDLERTKAQIWAPRFTLGTLNDEVAQVHAKGKQAFVWTLDVPPLIQQFLQDGDFDGILSNYPSSVAYHFYVQQ